MELQGGRSSQKENDHAINMVLAMITAFFVCWLPYTILSVVVVVDPELYIPPLLATMPMYFAKTSPVYNPIIYFLSNKRVSRVHLQEKTDPCTQTGSRTETFRLHVTLEFFFMVFFTQQFRDAALELLSCGRYIPHAPTDIGINMRSLNRRNRLTSLSRTAHSKVLPL